MAAAPAPASPAKPGRSADYEYLMSMWFVDSPFDILYAPGRGRYMVAKDDMKAGDHVVRSFPYCYAVCDEVKEYTCQYCFNDQARTRETLRYPCTDCNQTWYCSQACMKKDSKQHNIECKTLGTFFKEVHWEDPGNRTEVKLLLRTLSRRTLERRKIKLPQDHFYANERLKFDDFFRLTHDRKHYGPELLESLQGIVDYVKSLDTSWLSDITEHQLLDVVLKTRNNMFNVFRSSSISLGWGVYVEASLFNHSCQPNVCLFRMPDTPAFQFLAINDIKKGEELNVTYLGYGDLEHRRSHLLEHYFFKCDCVRCREEEGGSTAGYQRWYAESHCKRGGCLGYVVPLPTLGNRALAQPFCNYCSFTDDPVEDEEEEEEEEEQADDQTSASNSSASKKKPHKAPRPPPRSPPPTVPAMPNGPRPRPDVAWNRIREPAGVSATSVANPLLPPATK
jgi:SET and MYND domain-containing protein